MWIKHFKYTTINYGWVGLFCVFFGFYFILFYLWNLLCYVMFCLGLFLFQELTKDGPVVGVSKDDVSFIAEQVSHHPPGNFIFHIIFLKFLSKYQLT